MKKKEKKKEEGANDSKSINILLNMNSVLFQKIKKRELEELSENIKKSKKGYSS